MDDKQSVRIVVTGRILDGFDRAKVQVNLAKVARLDSPTAERLLAGTPHVVKKNLDTVTADTYTRRLQAIGVDCAAEPEYLTLEPQALPQSRSAAAPVRSTPNPPGAGEAIPVPAAPVRSTPNPTGTKKVIGKVIAIIFSIIMGVVVWVWLGTKFSSFEDTAKQNAAAEAAKCKLDLQCWGDKYLVAASVYCKRDVERLGQYSARWTDGTLESKFSRFKWLNKEQATVTFIGDKIEFQTGFGAYQNHIYECDLNPATNKILDVRIRPGRL